MKGKNFNYTSLYLYDKELVESLESDFKTSGINSKTQYLTSLIADGLRIKRNGRAQSTDISEIAEELRQVKASLLRLERQLFKEQTENEIYKSLLCNLYYLFESLICNEEISAEYIDTGVCDVLPDRLYAKLKKVRETYNNA